MRNDRITLHKGSHVPVLRYEKAERARRCHRRRGELVEQLTRHCVFVRDNLVELIEACEREYEARVMAVIERDLELLPGVRREDLGERAAPARTAPRHRSV